MVATIQCCGIGWTLGDGAESWKPSHSVQTNFERWRLVGRGGVSIRTLCCLPTEDLLMSNSLSEAAVKPLMIWRTMGEMLSSCCTVVKYPCSSWPTRSSRIVEESVDNFLFKGQFTIFIRSLHIFTLIQRYIRESSISDPLYSDWKHNSIQGKNTMDSPPLRSSFPGIAIWRNMKTGHNKNKCRRII